MSWNQLLSMSQENALEEQKVETEPPSSCPNDGEPLLPGPEDGVLYCPFDGWRYQP